MLQKTQILFKLWLIGYQRAKWSPIRSVIILVMKQIGLSLRCRAILLMITDWIGLHPVLKACEDALQDLGLVA